MDNLTASTSTVRPTVANLTPGRVYRAGYKRRTLLVFDNRFLNFHLTATGENFNSLAELKRHFNVTSLKELESVADHEDTSVYARFHDVEGDFTWAAYLFGGKFCVGTSADRLVLQAV